MRAGPSRAGFTLIEMMVAVAIVGVLAAMSFALMGRMTPRARLRDASQRITGELASGRSQAYGRSVRTALLINTAHDLGDDDVRVSTWLVLDPWSTLPLAMNNTNGWTTPADLVPPSPAPSGSAYRILNSETMERHVGTPADIAGPAIFPTTFRGSVPRTAYSGTSTTKMALCDAEPGFFPPPFCNIPVGGCTFCVNGRGAVVFEPDGRIRLLANDGTEAATRSGSLSLTAFNADEARSVVLNSAGLVRSF